MKLPDEKKIYKAKCECGCDTEIRIYKLSKLYPSNQRYRILFKVSKKAKPSTTKHFKFYDIFVEKLAKGKK